MNHESTAVVLIGYQNDYFAEDGILRGAVEESVRNSRVLENTLALLEGLTPTPTTLIQTPIIFTEEYLELSNPIGILKTIKEVEAFKEGTSGAEVIPEFQTYGDRILPVPGKRGLNAFSNTDLSAILQERDITDVVLGGCVTSICIDSTGRAALDHGYRVTILSDCTASRTIAEQNLYCESIFPIYASVCTSGELLQSLTSSCPQAS